MGNLSLAIPTPARRLKGAFALLSRAGFVFTGVECVEQRIRIVAVFVCTPLKVVANFLAKC